MSYSDMQLGADVVAQITGIPVPRAAPASPTRSTPPSRPAANRGAAPNKTADQPTVATRILEPNRTPAATPVIPPVVHPAPRVASAHTARGGNPHDQPSRTEISTKTGVPVSRGTTSSNGPPPFRNSRRPLSPRRGSPPPSPTRQPVRPPTRPPIRRVGSPPTFRHSPAPLPPANQNPPVPGPTPGPPVNPPSGPAPGPPANPPAGLPPVPRANQPPRPRGRRAQAPQLPRKSLWKVSTGWLYWTTLQLRYSLVGNWLAMECADVVTWWSKASDQRPSAVARPVIQVGNAFNSIMLWLYQTLLLIFTTICLLLVLFVDGGLRVVSRLMGFLPLRHVMFFSAVILGFRIPSTFWHTAAPWKVLVSTLAYGTWLLWLTNRYLWEPEAWRPRLSAPRNGTVPEFWDSALFWNVVAIAIIVWADIAGVTSPLLSTFGRELVTDGYEGE